MFSIRPMVPLRPTLHSKPSLNDPLNLSANFTRHLMLTDVSRFWTLFGSDLYFPISCCWRLQPRSFLIFQTKPETMAGSADLSFMLL